MGRPPAAGPYAPGGKAAAPGPGDPGDPAGKCRFSTDPMLPAKKIYEEDLGSHWITYLKDPRGDKLQVSSPLPMPADAAGIDFDWDNVCFFV